MNVILMDFVLIVNVNVLLGGIHNKIVELICQILKVLLVHLQVD